jgi:predicted DNA-binding transcriptional regulator YafY
MAKKDITPKKSKNHNQILRVMAIYQYAAQGKKFNIHEAINHIKEQGIDDNPNIRTVQRDLELLLNDLQYLRSEQSGKSVIYSIIEEYAPSTAISAKPLIENDELSVHFLKAHLKNYKNTPFASKINQLLVEINKDYPGDVIPDDFLYWNRSIGEYDYSSYANILKILVDAIVNKKWIKVQYQKVGATTKRFHEVFPLRIFNYNNGLYLVAYYPKYKSFINFKIEFIYSLAEPEVQYEIPKHDFDFEDYFKNRFGVMEGEIKDIKLRINKGYEGYFERRNWHQGSKFSTQNGYRILEMKSPINIELYSFLLSKNTMITVLEPKELKVEMKNLLLKLLEDY